MREWSFPPRGGKLTTSPGARSSWTCPGGIAAMADSPGNPNLSDRRSTALKLPPAAVTRRRFATGLGAAAALAPVAGLASRLAERNPDRIRLGLVGCGSRGVGAVMDAITSTPNVEVVALADAFRDRIEAALQRLTRPQEGVHREFASQYGDLVIEWTRFEAVKVPPENCFVGLDACRQLLATDVDVVILATPPVFRPGHIAAALAAGKHVFAEKPVAVDPVGVRAVLAAVERAKSRSLGLIGGTQLRHSPPYVETVARIHEGRIGEILSAECFWWHDYYVRYRARAPQPQWTDVEHQIRSWPQFVWLSGDHLVENLVHNIDVLNWVMGGPPASVCALGGHTTWEGWPVRGNVYDHFYVELTYARGVKAHASSRQASNCTQRLGERVVGARGVADPNGTIRGDRPFTFEGPLENPRFRQWSAFLASIRQGRPLVTAQDVAHSSMTAIAGRMSAYTGRTLSYEWALQRSQLELLPANLEFGPLPVAPVAQPGVTPLV